MEINIDQKNKNKDEEMDLFDYFFIIKKNIRSISIIFIIIMVITIAITFLTPKIYQSSSLVAPAKISNSVIEDPNNLINILKQEVTLQKLSQKINLTVPESTLLAKNFSVSLNGELFNVQGLGSNPEEAREITKAVDDFIVNYENSLTDRFKPDLQAEVNLLKDELDKNSTTISDLEKKIAASINTQSTAQGFITASYVMARQEAKQRRDELQKELYNKQRELNFQSQESSVLAEPVLAVNPIKPNKLLNIIGGAILAFFVAIFYAFIAESIQKHTKQI